MTGLPPPDSPGWVDQVAAALKVPAPSDEAIDDLLEVSRLVAHSTERRFTPLTTFLVGLSVGRRSALGEPGDRALDEALSIVSALADDVSPREG